MQLPHGDEDSAAGPWPLPDDPAGGVRRLPQREVRARGEAARGRDRAGNARRPGVPVRCRGRAAPRRRPGRPQVPHPTAETQGAHAEISFVYLFDII